MAKIPFLLHFAIPLLLNSWNQFHENFVAASSFSAYGTNNGYDVGGNESVCLSSELNDDADTPPANNDGGQGNDGTFYNLLQNASSIQSEDDAEAIAAGSEVLRHVNGALFARRQRRALQKGLSRDSVELMDDCLNGTVLELKALDLQGGLNMFRTVPYSFQIQFRISIAEKLPQNNHSSFAAAVFFRFVLCDAMKSGFCNPFVRNMVDENTTVVAVSGNRILSTNAKTTTTDDKTKSNATIAEKKEDLWTMVDWDRKLLFSPWALPTTTEIDHETNEIIMNDLEVQFAAMKNAPLGLYRLVVHSMVVVATRDDTTGKTRTVQRLDTAAEANISILNIQEAPKILEMTYSLRLFMYVMIGIYDAIVISLLVGLYRYRKHPAVQLAQGAFLRVLMVAALVGGTFTFTFMPDQDWYCLAWGPLIMFPFTVVGAILVARLWRVYVTLAGAMQLGQHYSDPKQKSSSRSSEPESKRMLTRIIRNVSTWNFFSSVADLLSFLAKLPLLTRLQQQSNNRKSSKFRQTASSIECAQLVIFLVLPQVVLQTVGNSIDTPGLDLVMDDSNRVGRYFCTRDWDWVHIAGLFLVALNFVLAVVMAWNGRDLPSIFNEKDAIFNTAISAAVILLINIMVVIMIEDPASSPDASAFIRCLALLSIAAIVIVNLVYPKIRRARSGEKIVVGKLLRMCGSSSTEDESSYANSGSSEWATTAPRRQTFIPGEHIVIRRNDALPQELEVQIHQLHSFLKSISEKCTYGQSLSKYDFEQMIRQVAKLKIDLDRVSLNWDEEGETETTNANDGGDRITIEAPATGTTMQTTNFE